MRSSPAAVAKFTIRPNSACKHGSWRRLSAGLARLRCAIAFRVAALGLRMIVPFTLPELAAPAPKPK